MAGSLRLRLGAGRRLWYFSTRCGWEAADDPSISWLDLRGCVWGQVEDCGISQLDVVGKLIKGNVSTEVIHDEEDLAP